MNMRFGEFLICLEDVHCKHIISGYDRKRPWTYQKLEGVDFGVKLERSIVLIQGRIHDQILVEFSRAPPVHCLHRQLCRAGNRTGCIGTKRCQGRVFFCMDFPQWEQAVGIERGIRYRYSIHTCDLL